MFRYFKNFFLKLFETIVPTNPASLPMLKYPIPDHDSLFLIDHANTLNKESENLSAPYRYEGQS